MSRQKGRQTYRVGALIIKGGGGGVGMRLKGGQDKYTAAASTGGSPCNDACHSDCACPPPDPGLRESRGCVEQDVCARRGVDVGEGVGVRVCVL